MIYLDSTTKNLQAVLSGAITTSQPEGSAYYYDITPQSTTNLRRGGVKVTVFNSTTDVNLVEAPVMQGTSRNIHTLFIHNKDTVAVTITIKIDDGGTETILVKQAVSVGESLVYEDGRGWEVLSPNIFPVIDTTEIVKGSGDDTKRMRLEVDGVTTATTRVMTIPDANIKLSGHATGFTDTRVPYATGTTGGVLTDSANMTFNGTTLTVGGVSTSGTVTTAITDTRVVYSSSGVLVGSANMVFSGTTLTLSNAVASSMLNMTTSGSTITLSLTDTGVNGVNIQFIGNGVTTPNKYLRVASGNLEVVNSAYGAIILTLSDVGALTLPSGLTATTGIFTSTLRVDGNVTLGDASGDTLTIVPNAVTWSNNPTHSGNHIFSGNITVQGNTTIGNASTDTLTFHPNTWALTNNVTISGTWTDLGIVTTVDINGGTVDGTVIGGTSAAAGSFTTLASSGNATLGDAAGDAHTANGTLTANHNVKISPTAGNFNVGWDGSNVESWAIISRTNGVDGTGGTAFTSSEALPMASGSGFIGYSGLVIAPNRWGNATTVDDHRTIYLAGSQRNSGGTVSGLAFANWGYFTGTGSGVGGLQNATSRADAVKFLFEHSDNGEFTQTLTLKSRNATGATVNAISVVSSGAVTLGSTLTVHSVTSTGATGTGNIVFSASPTLSGTVGGALTFSGALTLSSALTYGGVTLSNAVTGTGNMVLSASPTFTGTITAAIANFSGNVTLGDANTDAHTVNGSLSITDSGAVDTLTITDTGANGANIKLTGDGVTTPSKTLRVIAGAFEIVNNAYTADIFKVTDAGAVTISSTLSIHGVTSAGATGTGNMVFSASPTLSGTVGGALTFSGALTLSAALTYGGVTLSNAVTGTGNMVLSASPTLTGTLTAATGTFSGQVQSNSINVVTLSETQTLTGKTHTNPANTDQTLTDGATVDWNMNSGGIATVTLGGNRTMAAPTNLKKGTYILYVIQDATGSRTITWNAVFKWSGGVAPTLSTTASDKDVLTFVCDGTNLYGAILSDVS